MTRRQATRTLPRASCARSSGACGPLAARGRLLRPSERRVIGGLALALATLLALPLSGCARAPRGPDFLRVRLRHDPPTLDPALANDVSSTGVLAPIFETLVRVDPSTLELGPSLATSWEISRDGLTYTFHLR